jgi:hypothetical protein
MYTGNSRDARNAGKVTTEGTPTAEGKSTAAAVRTATTAERKQRCQLKCFLSFSSPNKNKISNLEVR